MESVEQLEKKRKSWREILTELEKKRIEEMRLMWSPQSYYF
jgi:hypothetical protein